MEETAEGRAAAVPINTPEGLAAAQELDANDELKEHRGKFHFPKVKVEGKEADSIYLCGNSLGLQHKDVKAETNAYLDKWAAQGVMGHWSGDDKWFEADEWLKKPMAKIVGAKEEEVMVAATLTNLIHLLFMAFYKPEGKRKCILIEKNPFPSDMYAMLSQIRSRGLDTDECLLEVGPREGEESVRTEDILKVIEERGEEIAVTFFSGVHFMSGQYFDIPAITQAAHAKGCTVGFDLAHAAGNIDLKLNEWGVDFAAWCTYKYLCGGPGNIGAGFVHEKHDCAKLHKLEGWWGHKKEGRFGIKRDFDGGSFASSFQLSTPSVACMATLAPSVRLIAEVGVDKLYQKSRRLTRYMFNLFEKHLPEDIEILTPKDPERRGAQMSIRLLRAPSQASMKKSLEPLDFYECGTEDFDNLSFSGVAERHMEAIGLIVDKRPPDIIRVTAAPLYNSFSDVYTFVAKLAELIPRLRAFDAAA